MNTFLLLLYPSSSFVSVMKGGKSNKGSGAYIYMWQLRHIHTSLRTICSATTCFTRQSDAKKPRGYTVTYVALGVNKRPRGAVALLAPPLFPMFRTQVVCARIHEPLATCSSEEWGLVVVVDPRRMSYKGFGFHWLVFSFSGFSVVNTMSGKRSLIITPVK